MENKDADKKKIIKESNELFINNEIQRLTIEKFHLQNYSSQLYKDYLNLVVNWEKINKENIELNKELKDRDIEIDYLEYVNGELESDLKKLEKSKNEKKRKRTEDTKETVDSLDKVPTQKMKIIPTEISYSSEEINELFSNINTIDDIINLPEDKYIHHNGIMKKLLKLREPLRKLKNMIGLNEIKEEIFKHIIYFIMNEQELQENYRLHTVIQGPPGVGKTMYGRILADIYLAIGLLEKDLFKMVKRSDLIGEYLGQTAIKTQKVIDEALGGVLFIDEAYSLGNKEKRDMYSKECLDTLNRNLTEKGNKFICIIAGYEKDLNECFFSSNSGLERRFTFRYTINGYDEIELTKIFKLKCSDSNWKYDIKDEDFISFFKNNELTHFAGDIDRLLFQSQLMASLRIFKDNKENYSSEKTLILSDLEISIKQVVKEKEVEDSSKWVNMFM